MGANRITVMITTYNSSPFIRETIESVLNQTFSDFELLVGDDCSTDDTCEIVERYKDSRIRLIRCEHNFIETENRLLYEAKGKYIARLDHDDRMLPDRLKIQYDYMEAHPEIDALGGGAVCFGAATGKFTVEANRKFTVNDFLKANLIVNPSVMLRRETIVRHNLRYKQRYLYSDDYGFWADMLKLGLHIENIPDILIEYRISPTQASSAHADIQAESANNVALDLQNWLAKKFCPPYAIPVIKNTEKRLTVIIPFLNEGEEIVNTVKSVRETVGDAVDIITINDLSTDGYPYMEELKKYNVYYVFNMERKGVAASRDLGIELCQTPYFLLLDGHMRFYAKDWEEILTTLLKNDDRCILCCQGHALQKENGVVSDFPMESTNYGAFFPFLKGICLVDIRWNTHEYSNNPQTDPIAAILGAGYAASKRYWQYLKGLEGLVSYGSDEPYISLKAWLEGGKCLLVKNVVIGHIYRRTSPFRRYKAVEVYNQLLISHLLYPQSWHAMNLAYFYLSERYNYKYAIKRLKKEQHKWIDRKAYYKKISNRDFSFLVKLQQRILHNENYELIRYSDRLPHILDYLLNNIPEKDGLCEGKLGVLIWLCHYAEINWQDCIGSAVEKLWGEIAADIKKECLPLNFRHGLAGIGWGLIYAKENELIEDEIEYLLKMIDKQLSYINLRGVPNTVSDEDFGLGIGGYIAYYAARLRYSYRNGNTNVFDETKLAEIKDAAQRIINDSHSFTAISYAFRILLLTEHGYEENDMPLNIREWLECSSFIPKNSKYWSKALADMTMNTSLAVMKSLKIQKLKQEKFVP